MALSAHSTVRMFLDFHGRIRRRDFWLYGCGMAVVFLAARWILAKAIGLAWTDPRLTLLGLLTAWPSSAITVKRLHDRGYSGWWSVIGWLGPLYMDAVILGFVLPAGLTLTALVQTGVRTVDSCANFWLFIEIGVREGTKGPNRFGPSPKGIGGPEIATADVFD